MISGANRINHIRFDVKDKYKNQYFIVDEFKRIEYEVGFVSKVKANVLNIRLRINYTDTKTNEEIIGHLCEKRGILDLTNMINDKAFLIQYIKDFLLNVDLYWQQNIGIVWLPKTNEIDVNIFADTILDDLNIKGFYK